MKIALVTIHNANNYGAIFQAFALKEKLSRYGEVEVIDYDNRHISRSFDLIRFKCSIHGLMGAGKDLFRVLPRARAIAKFKRFMQLNFKYTDKFSQFELLQGKMEGFDCYVAGSDQIWNPACISDRKIIDPIYFLSFAPRGVRKISYASSLGSYIYSESEQLVLKELLGSFDSVAVREQSAQRFLSDMLGKEVVHVLDPTLLLSKDEWLDRAGLDMTFVSEEKYILLYTVPKVPLIKKAVEYVAQKMNLKIISLEQGLSAGAKVDQQIRDAGPLEFIKLFAGAEFVVTDSFHGVCFSVNFHKPFMAVSPGKNSNRLESLLKLLGLEGHMISLESELDGFTGFEVNISYEVKLLEARRTSVGYLDKCLGSIG